MEKVAGILEVSLTEDTHEIVIVHPNLKPDSDGAGRIVLSPRHSRHLASLLLEQAKEAEDAARDQQIRNSFLR